MPGTRATKRPCVLSGAARAPRLCPVPEIQLRDRSDPARSPTRKLICWLCHESYFTPGHMNAAPYRIHGPFLEMQRLQSQLSTRCAPPAGCAPTPGWPRRNCLVRAPGASLPGPRCAWKSNPCENRIAARGKRSSLEGALQSGSGTLSTALGTVDQTFGSCEPVR